MVVTEADMERVLRELAELEKLKTADELEVFIENRVNPLKELRRPDGGPERRSWPRTSWRRDFYIVLWPVLIVGGVALIAWGLFGWALLKGWLSL